MGTGTLIKNRTDFENLIQTQVKKGQDLLKRNISEDSTTIINKRVGYVFKSKEYDGVIYIYRMIATVGGKIALQKKYKPMG